LRFLVDLSARLVAHTLLWRRRDGVPGFPHTPVPAGLVDVGRSEPWRQTRLALPRNAVPHAHPVPEPEGRFTKLPVIEFDRRRGLTEASAHQPLLVGLLDKPRLAVRRRWQDTSSTNTRQIVEEESTVAGPSARARGISNPRHPIACDADSRAGARLPRPSSNSPASNRCLTPAAADPEGSPRQFLRVFASRSSLRELARQSAGAASALPARERFVSCCGAGPARRWSMERPTQGRGVTRVQSLLPKDRRFQEVPPQRNSRALGPIIGLERSR